VRNISIFIAETAETVETLAIVNDNISPGKVSHSVSFAQENEVHERPNDDDEELGAVPMADDNPPDVDKASVTTEIPTAEVINPMGSADVMEDSGKRSASAVIGTVPVVKSRGCCGRRSRKQSFESYEIDDTPVVKGRGCCGRRSKDKENTVNENGVKTVPVVKSKGCCGRK
jgi:hypothetical protein